MFQASEKCFLRMAPVKTPTPLCKTCEQKLVCKTGTSGHAIVLGPSQSLSNFANRELFIFHSSQSQLRMFAKESGQSF